MRRPHILRDNKGTELPNAAVWVDTETKATQVSPELQTHHLNFGWACFSRTRGLDDWTTPTWFRFDSAAMFWDWVESLLRPKIRLYMFAHNWSFDGPVVDMFNALPLRGWKPNKLVIDGPPLIVRWRKESSSILCLDTLNWWRMKLETVGESLGLAKLPFPDKHASREEWDTYCKRDVQIIHRVMLAWWRFIRVNDLGSFGPTLASQSVRAFRHRFMDHEILIDDNVKALTLSRDSLHGGRVECFRIGKIQGPITVLDVNSMYPFVMRDHVYPAKLKFHTSVMGLSELKKWSASHCVIARVRLHTKRRRFAHVSDGRLVVPIGRFIEPLTTPDLQDAIAHGEVHSVIEAAVYTAEPIFKRFVVDCYSLRQDAMRRGDSVSSWLIKILMNSLYGKFGQRGIMWDIVRETEDRSARQWVDYDYDTGAVTTFRQIAGVVQSQSTESESFDSFPAIASHVTAYARAYLGALIDKAGSESVLYVDTDSLFLSGNPSKSLAALIDPSVLGGLKHEATHEWIRLYGPKDYKTPDKEVIKGIRASAVRIDDHTFQQEQFSSLVGLINAGEVSAPRIKQIRKVLARRYLKGIVQKNGLVSPFNLREF